MNLTRDKTMVGSRLTILTRVVILTALYFLGGMLGKEASFLSESIALVWPPAGIALAAIILFGYKFWPGVALGAILFSFTNGVPFGFFTLGTAIGNTVGAIICAFLLERITKFDKSLERTRDVVGYICFACFFGTTVNAAFTVTGLAYAGEISWDNPFSTVLRWWVPNALAGLVVAPFIITWAAPSSVRWNTKLIIEAVICGIGLIAGTLISFNSWFAYGIQNYPLAYLPFPFLVWGALRFGQRGATTGTLLVSALAIHSLLGKGGPFFMNNETDSLMLIGSYIGILAVTNMLLAAASAERKRAELAMSQSEKRFRAVVEDQTDLICRFKPDGTVTFVNGAFARFHQKENALLIGTNWLQTLSKEDTDVVASYFCALPKDQPVVSFDQRVFTPDGKAVWQQHTVRRLFAEHGDTLEFQAVIQDITQRKESEQLLLASEKKYRSLLANIPDIVWAGTARGQLTYVSDNVEHILGYSPLEFTTTNTLWLERIHPSDRGAVEKAHEMLSSERISFHLEYRIQRKDDQWIWLHSRASATRMQDGILYAEGLSSDITQRKSDEEALRCAKESSEAANRAKSQFLANMSHELRTPLNAIIGFSEILADKTFGELNPRQLKYSNNILGSGRHLLQLINDILDLSKVEAGRMELSTTPISVSQVMQEVLSIVKNLANKKAIDLRFDIARDLPVLQADPAKFKQIMYNLLSNAIKFTPKEGRIVVTAQVADDLEFSANSEGIFSSERGLKVSVADNGIGIELKDQERVFVEFEQVDSSYVRQENGTGLGLALTKKLVNLHGGKIWVESQGANQGSTFTFVLPLAQTKLSRIDPPKKIAPNADYFFSPKILVVTNEADSREAIASYLNDAGYSADFVQSTAQMADALKTNFPYAVILDQNLADKPGSPEWTELGSMIPQRIPLVVFSCESENPIAFRLFQEGPTGVSSSRLADTLRQQTKTSGPEVKKVLVIEDDESIIRLTTLMLLQKGFGVLQATTGTRGIEFAQTYQPAVIILDLKMPDCNGTEVVERLRGDPQTKDIPILIHTGTVLDERMRKQLAAHVQSITFKTEAAKLFATVERLSNPRTVSLHSL